MQTRIIKTSMGEIKGLEAEDYLEFRGIKYASAGRWQYPSVIESWDGVFDATEYGPCCPQERAFDNDAERNPFFWKEFREHQTFTYSEDCLNLNIVTPKNAEKCPVLIYTFGGAFVSGSADECHTHGKELAKNGIIWVAMNYRVSPYGFCAHPDLKDSEGKCGNYGLYDQMLAIEWVKKHIAEFGGDPEKITLSGESAGGMSVDLLLSTDRMKKIGLHGAVIMSAAGIQRAVAKPKTPEKSRAFWDKVVAYAGKENIKQVRDELSDEELYRAWRKAFEEEKIPLMSALPTYDGELITKQNFKMKAVPTDIPMVVSVTSKDMFCYALLKVSQAFAKKGLRNGNKVWMANFARALPGDNMGAWHSSDLLYVFNTLDISWRPFEDVDRKIANQMSKSFAAFIKTGNPNCEEIPNWEIGVKNPMRFCEQSKMTPWDKKYMFDKTIHNEGPM